MIFNFKNEADRYKAKEYLNRLLSLEKTVEIKEVRRTRSLSQNRYLHLILAWFAYQTGYTLEETKQYIFKKIVNPEIFYLENFTGAFGEVERWRSTRDLDTKEMTTAIDKFRDYSAIEAGIYLPEPKDLSLIQNLEFELRNNGVKI